jgi:uncharacterized OsmC-like protein
MDSERFRSAQEPIRARYKKDAKAAFLTLKAKGTADESTVTCKVETGRGLALAGVHPKGGGSGRELCSGDMLLEALIACAGVSMRAAAAVLEVELESVEVFAEGDVDFRGALGIAADVRVGFETIRLRFNIVTDAPQETVDQLIRLTESYCVVFQTLQRSPKTQVEFTCVPGKGRLSDDTMMAR